MNAATQQPGFRRQIVVRLDADEWALLERAVSEHGSIQAAVTAALRAVARATPAPQTKPREEPSAKPASTRETDESANGDRPIPDRSEEITARDAAKVLGLKPGTVRGYIRSGRIPGRYEGEPTWRGWLTTRAAVENYRSR